MPAYADDRSFLARIGPVLAFTLVYLVVSGIAAWQGGNSEFVFYIVVMLVLMGVVGLVDRSVRLTRAALWALSLWGLAHMAGGLVEVPSAWPVNGESRVLYNWWLIPDRLKYDQVVHAYGFGVATWVCWQGMRAAILRAGGEPRPTAGLLLVAAVAGMGLGAANEVVEFFATLLVPETNVGGYINTGWDLVANLVGCVIAAVLIRVFGRR